MKWNPKNRARAAQSPQESEDTGMSNELLRMLSGLQDGSVSLTEFITAAEKAGAVVDIISLQREVDPIHEAIKHACEGHMKALTLGLLCRDYEQSFGEKLVHYSFCKHETHGCEEIIVQPADGEGVSAPIRIRFDVVSPDYVSEFLARSLEGECASAADSSQQE
jgi:hypothetical protein